MLNIYKCIAIIFKSITILFTILFCNSLAIGNEDQSTKKDLWYTFYVKKDGVPVYEKPTTNSRIIGNYDKAYTLEIKTENTVYLKWKKSGWLYYPGGYNKPDWMPKEPVKGWVQVENLLETKDFIRIEQWPFLFLLKDTRFYATIYCFRNDGAVSVVDDDYEIYPEWKPKNDAPLSYKRHIYLSDDIVVIREADGLFNASGEIYDRNNNRLCPPGSGKKECDKLYRDRGGYHWIIGRVTDESKETKIIHQKYCVR